MMKRLKISCVEAKYQWDTMDFFMTAILIK